MDLQKLIKSWEKQSEKCLKLGRDATNSYTAERYFADSQTLSVCADQLRRELQEVNDET